MFCKRIKKEIPPEAFISTSARVVAILQLCLAFTVLLWQAGYPFAGEHYATKTKLLVYQHVIGTKNIDYANQFEQLPMQQQQQILDGYDTLLQKIDRPFMDKLIDSFKIIFIKTPIAESVWILLSIIIPILLLKRTEGAIQAVWLLPLAMLLLTIDNRWSGKDVPIAEDAVLYPTEQLIVKKYLENPLSADILEQHAQLSKGWELYLIKEWAHEEPSSDSRQYQKQKEKGDFFFNLARLDYIKPTQKESRSRYSYYFLGLGLFWNWSFAMIVWMVLVYSKSKNAPIPAK